MLSIFILFSITLSYFLNIDENKIFTPSLQSSEYEQQNQKIIENVVGTIQEEITVIAVATQLLTNNIIQVAVLAQNLQNENQVYTITYNSLLMSNFKITQYSLNTLSCRDIAFIQQQYIVLCGMQLITQNGTKIQIQQQTKQIQSYWDGIVAISDQEIIIFDHNLNIISQQKNEAIEVKVTNRYMYLLKNKNIEIQPLQSDEEIEEVSHNCTSKPRTLAIFSDSLFIYCNQLLKIDNKGQTNQVTTQSSITNLGQTTNFILINQQQIFNKEQQQIFSSNYHLYSINYQDQLLIYKSKQFQIIQIFDRSIINSKSFTSFSIQGLNFTVIDYGIQQVNESFMNGSLYKPQQDNLFYYDDFVLGNSITVEGDGNSDIPIKSAQFPTLGLVKVLNYGDNEMAFFYHEYSEQLKTSQVQVMLCNFYIEEKILYKCNQKFTISNNNYYKQVYDPETDQDVLIVTSNSSKTYVYIDDQRFTLTDVDQQIYLSQQLLAILSDDYILTIYRLDIKQYILEDQIKLDSLPWFVTLDNNQLCVVEGSKNKVSVYEYSIFGWYKVQEENVSYVQSAHFQNGQLFIFLQKEILIYQQQVLRGKITINLVNYTTKYSDNFIYLSNINETIQISTCQQKALSTLQLRTFNHQQFKDGKFVSFDDYELNFVEEQVFAFPNKKQFNIDTITSKEQYFDVIKKQLIFKGSDNQQRKQDSFVIATKLQLVNQQNQSKLAKNFQMSDYFDGPVSNLTILELDKAVLIPKINQIDKLPEWSYSNQLVDILDIGNGNTIVYSYQLIQSCQDSQCKRIKSIEELNCYNLEQDQLSIFLVCQFYIYSIRKDNFDDQNTLKLQFTNAIKSSFDNNYIAVLDSNHTIFLYQNFQLQGSMTMNNSVDLILSQKKLLVLTDTELIVLDLDLKIIYQIDLIKQLSIQKNSALFWDSVFKQIVQFKENQYVISTNNALIYKINLLSNNSIEVISKFVPVPNYTPLQIQILNQSIVSILFQHENQQLLIFYDDQKGISPYYQSLQIYKKISKYYIRQFDGNKFLMRDINNSSKFIGYEINKYYAIKLLTNTDQTVTLLADDFGTQNASKIINLSYTSDEENEQSARWFWIGYVFLFMLIFVIGILVYRYGRRFWLLKKINFIEDKQGSGSDNEINI